MPSTTSSDIISQIQAYKKELKEHQNTLSFDAEKYLSLFNRLDDIKVSNKESPDTQKQLEELQKDFDEFEKQNQMHRDDYEKKTKDIQQRESSYISSNLTKDDDTDKLINVLKSGVMDYKYAVNLIQHNNDIKQKIRDGKYIIARKGNRVALIAADKEIIGYKQELTNFLQSQDNKDINNIVLSNVPIYNNGSHVLSFEKDVRDLPDNVLKIYFSVENNSKLDFVADARKEKLYCDVITDVLQRLNEYQQNNADGKKVNVQIEGSSYGIDPLLMGVLSVKKHNTQQCLSLSNGCINLSMIPRSLLNGIKPETTAEKIDELFQWAVADGYNIQNKDMSFVNLDVLSNDNFGRFEYHDIGSTDSFLKELSRLQTIYNNSRANTDKQTLLVAVNEAMRPVIKKNSGIIDKGVGFLTGTAKQDLFKNIANGDSVYPGIVVKTMSDLADEISRKNTMQNNTAGISKNNKDGILHTVNSDKTVNNGFVKSQAIEDKTVKKNMIYGKAR